MRILVCGGRNFNDADLLGKNLDQVICNDSEIVIGGARGADKLAGEYAKVHNIECRVFLPEWKKYRKAAGPIRNQQMLEYIEEDDDAVLVAFWDGKSKGARDMINRVNKAGIKTVIVRYSDDK